MELRAVAVVCVVALAATSCTMSRLDQDEAVRISGRLLDEAGAPRPGAPVVLAKEVDLGEALFGVTVAVGTLGLVCLAEPGPAICSKSRRATTGPDGRFTFDLRGRDTHGLVGTASTFHLSARASVGPGDARGPMVTARFDVQTPTRELPELRLWRPRVTAAGGRVEWTPMDPASGPPEGYAVSYFGDPARAPVWTVEGPSPATVDPRVLEDARGTVAVDAVVTHEPAGGRVRVTSRSAAVPWTGPAGAPPSRGAPCWSYASSGDTAAPLSPCTLTDGDFSGPVAGTPSDTSAGVRTAIAVDLGRSRPVSLVVARGCPADCTVETSADGRTWSAAGTGTGARFTVAPRAGATAHWVRVRSTSGVDVSRLAEISAW